MNVEFAFLCDYAAPDAKFTAIGIGIDTIYTDSVPAVHAHIFAVLAVRFTANEAGRPREYEMNVQDADGKDIITPVTDRVEIAPAPDGISSLTHRFVNGLYGVRFEEFGDYQVSWLIDGTEQHVVPLRVAKPE